MPAMDITRVPATPPSTTAIRTLPKLSNSRRNTSPMARPGPISPVSAYRICTTGVRSDNRVPYRAARQPSATLTMPDTPARIAARSSFSAPRTGRTQTDIRGQKKMMKGLVFWKVMKEKHAGLQQEKVVKIQEEIFIKIHIVLILL